MRDYELLYIIKPEVAEEAIDGIVEKFNGPSAAVDECERLLKIDDNILRQLTTKVGE